MQFASGMDGENGFMYGVYYDAHQSVGLTRRYLMSLYLAKKK